MKNYRNTWMDLMNIVATISVIAMHCNGCFWQYSNTLEWKSSVIIECMCYWAVPIFFMLTGANLIDYHERYNTKQFFVQRIKRTVIPYLFFTMFAIIFLNIKKLDQISSEYIINTFLNGDVLVYWFFIPLFGIYLSIPALSSVKKNDRKRVYSYIVIVGFITVSFFPYVCKMFGLDWSLLLPISGGYIIYALLGYLLTHCVTFSKTHRFLIYVGGVIGLLGRMIPTYILSISEGMTTEATKGYLTPMTVMYSLAIFTFFRYEVNNYLENMEINFAPILCWLSKNSFGVYLIHAYITTYLPKILNFENTSYFWRFCAPILVYAVCVILISGAKKIPILKNFR